jgi:hypothetical protein
VTLQQLRAGVRLATIDASGDGRVSLGVEVADQAQGRAWLVKYDGVCSRCGIALLKGTPAVSEGATKSIRCVLCSAADGGP